MCSLHGCLAQNQHGTFTGTCLACARGMLPSLVCHWLKFAASSSRRQVRLQADRSSSSSSRIADTETDEELEQAMEEVLRKQQEKESGEAWSVRTM